MNVVTLEWYERLLAKVVGSVRNASALHRRSKDANGPPASDACEQHVNAAAAELAFAKWAGLYWPGSIDTYKSVPDVDRFEVRWSRNPTSGLRIYERDALDRPYVLVTGLLPTFTIRGWYWGYAAPEHVEWYVKPSNWREHYSVPQASLYDPTLLLPAHRYLPGEMLCPVSS